MADYRDQIKAAHGHAARAAGLLVLMEVRDRANMGRLQEAARCLDEAAAQAREAIAIIERRLADEAAKQA